MNPLVLPALTLGLAAIAGLLLAPRLSPGRPSAVSDLDLRSIDLSERRDELFDRLRADEGHSEQDRETLERQAALVLRELERVEAERRQLGQAQPRAAAPAPLAPRHPVLAGALAGAGAVSLVVLLVMAAGRTAPPGAPAAAGETASSPGNGGAAGAEEAPLPPEVASQVERLTAQLSGGAADAEVHARLADLYLASGRFFEAHGQAERELALAPDSSHGLYVQGVVRFMMGQVEPSLRLLDSALASDPANSQAAIMKGVFLLRAFEDRDGARAVWSEGYRRSGNTDATLRHLLEQLGAGKTVAEILASPPPR